MKPHKHAPDMIEEPAGGRRRLMQMRTSTPVRKGDQIEKALAILEVSAPELESSPRIEHLFQAIEGKKKVFEYLGGSDVPEARKILELRRVLTGLQAKYLPFDAYCIAAKIPVKNKFGIIAAEVCDQEQKAKQLLLAAHHNEIVEKTFQMAMKDAGDRDRRMLHHAAGFLPFPKHALCSISANVDVHTQTSNVAVLPPIESSIN